MSQSLHSGKHPDADQLNTFVEGAASAYQREDMLVHLAECAACRELVFVLQGSAGPEPEAARKPVPVRWRWFMPLGLAGAALACGITVLVYLDMHRRPAEPLSQTAMLKSAPQIAPPTVATPVPVRGAPVARNMPRPEGRTRPGERTEASGAAGGAANGTLISVDQPAPPPAAAPSPAPVAEAGTQVSPEVVQRETKSEAANGESPVLTGRNLAALTFSRAAPALRIEHDRGPADGSSEISGRVTDMSGALIAGAEIALRDAAGATRQTTSGADGRFSLAGVAPGHYTLNVTARGFQTVQQAMNLQPRDVASLDTVLPVGSESEAVTVEAEQSSVQTLQAPMSDASNRIAGELPSRLPATEKVAQGKRMLSIDAAGTLFLSRNGGKNWKKVKPPWTGKAAGLALVDQSPETSGGIEAKQKSNKQGGAQLFEITTDSGAVWISDDGAHWRSR